MATHTSATCALVVNVFPPFRTQQSPSRTAGCACRAASDPASGSVSDQQPIHSPARAWECSAPFAPGAGEINMVRAERNVRGDAQRDRRIDARHLLHQDRVIDVAISGASQIFRKNRAQHAQLTQPVKNVDRKMLRLIPLHHVRAGSRLPQNRESFSGADSVPACKPKSIRFRRSLPAVGSQRTVRARAGSFRPPCAHGDRHAPAEVEGTVGRRSIANTIEEILHVRVRNMTRSPGHFISVRPVDFLRVRSGPARPAKWSRGRPARLR